MTATILGIGILIGFFFKTTINEYQKMRINNKAYGFGYAAGYKVGLSQNGMAIKQFEQVDRKLNAYICCQSVIPKEAYR